MERPRILVVDDEAVTTNSIKDYLSERIECEILVKDNGETALAALSEEKYDILLLDMKMPGISGKEVLRNVIKEKIEINILVITKIDDPELSIELNDNGIEYIPKPFSLKYVKKRVEAILKEKQRYVPKL